jgi:hypothetical protein
MAGEQRDEQRGVPAWGRDITNHESVKAIAKTTVAFAGASARSCRTGDSRPEGSLLRGTCDSGAINGSWHDSSRGAGLRQEGAIVALKRQAISHTA